MELRSPNHKPINPLSPRYYQYRNAEQVGENLFRVELGMGTNPKVWRLAYLYDDDDNLRIRGWMVKRRDNQFSITWLVGDFFDPAIVEGNRLTLEQAEQLLRTLAGDL